MDKWRRQADSARERGPDSRFQEVLTVVKSGDRRGRIKVRGICAIGRFWDAISASKDVRTRCRDAGIGEIL
jgi:hypothetical protein